MVKVWLIRHPAYDSRSATGAIAALAVGCIFLARYCGYRWIRPDLVLHPLEPPASASHSTLAPDRKYRRTGFAVMWMGLGFAVLLLVTEFTVPTTPSGIEGALMLSALVIACCCGAVYGYGQTRISLAFEQQGFVRTPPYGRSTTIRWSDLARAVVYQSRITTDAYLRLEYADGRRWNRIAIGGYGRGGVRALAAGFRAHGVPCFWQSLPDDKPRAAIGGPRHADDERASQARPPAGPGRSL